MTDDPVRLERRGRVAVVTLNRPDDLNTFDRAMYAAFDARLAEAAADDGSWAVVIAAAGERAFCAGVDVKALERDLSSSGSTHGYGPLGLTQSLVTAKPVIAAVHGHCIGEGVALALGADLVVASTDAQFSVPEARIGVNAIDIPLLLARKLDYGRAIAILASAAPVPAEECHRIGLVHTLADPGGALDRALALATTITETLAPLAVQAMKETLYRAYVEGPAAARSAGQTWRERILRSADFREGREAFAQKRTPRFEGR